MQGRNAPQTKLPKIEQSQPGGSEGSGELPSPESLQQQFGDSPSLDQLLGAMQIARQLDDTVALSYLKSKVLDQVIKEAEENKWPAEQVVEVIKKIEDILFGDTGDQATEKDTQALEEDDQVTEEFEAPRQPQGLPGELMYRLGSSREAYLEQCAKEQTGQWRYLKPGGKVDFFLRKTKIGTKIADRATAPSKRLAELSHVYEVALDEAHGHYEAYLQQQVANGEVAESEVRERLVGWIAHEYAENTKRVAEIKQEASDDPRAANLRKKAGYITAALLGSVLTYPLGIFGGMFVGAAGAGWVRARANKQSGSPEASTAGLTEDITSFSNDLQEREQQGGPQGEEAPLPDSKVITGQLNAQTAEKQVHNRNRLFKAMGIVALAILGSRFALNAVSASGPVAERAVVGGGIDPIGDGSGGSINTYPPITETVPGAEATFMVEPGNGYTHELQQLAQRLGQQLTPEDAGKLHQYLMGEFGPDYIDIAGDGNDIMPGPGGDVWLAGPGEARWKPRVASEIISWMNQQGLWK